MASHSTRWKYGVTHDKDGWTVAIWCPTPSGAGHARYLDVRRRFTTRRAAEILAKRLRWSYSPELYARDVVTSGVKPYRSVCTGDPSNA